MEAALSFLLSFARTRFGSVLLAGGLAFAGGYWMGYSGERDACRERERAAKAELERKTAAESFRRELELLSAQRAAAADVERLKSQKNDLEAKLKEAADASRANDARPCLDTRSVRRLNRL